MADYPELTAGVYQHYKGPHYLVLGLAHDANDESRVCVVYVCISEMKPGAALAVRTVDDFLESVMVRTESDAGGIQTRIVPRFRYVGPVRP
jgi:hypothetical protein